jgi:hypothetical protein
MEFGGIEQSVHRDGSAIRFRHGLAPRAVARPPDARVELLQVDTIAEHVVGACIEGGGAVARAQVVIGQ